MAVGLAVLWSTACGAAQPTPTPVPEVSQIPAATPGPLIRVPEAAEACDTAIGPTPITSPDWTGLAGQPIGQPILIMFKYRDEDGWYARPGMVPGYTMPSDTQAVAAVICVRQRAFTVGTYDQLAPANRLDWDLLAMDWPGRRVLAVNSLEGGDPPERMPVGQAGYGDPPTLTQFGAWTADLLAP